MPNRVEGILFVGRQQELAALLDHLEAARHSVGGIVLIAGEPGIGKTRLAEETGARARELGMGVLWGRCYEGEGAPSFWPWVQVIRTYVREHDADLLREQMGPGAADIAQVVVEVRERLPDLAPPPSVEPTQARFRFFDSVATFLARAARAQPLLLVLDDLHWADGPSLLLLQFLARELQSTPLLVVGTYRDAEIDRESALGGLTATLAELTRSGDTERLLLSGLGDADVARFIALGDDGPVPVGLVETIARETEGNPFFVTQVVRLLNAEGRLQRPDTPAAWNLAVPPSVREVLSRRLERLSPACQRVLSVAALLGREFRLAALERAAELAGEPLLDAIDEAMRARVVSALGGLAGAAGTYSFVHALMRETLYDELGAAARVRLHRQAGEVLETLYATDPGPHLAELAYHFTQAALGGGADKAVDYARRAGDRALSLLAFEDAALHYGRALETLRLKEPLDRPAAFELLLAMGDAWSRGGQTQRAKDACLETASLARALGDPERLARAALGLSTAQPAAGRVYTDRVELLEEALSVLDERTSALRARLLGRLARELYWSSSRTRRDELSRQAVEMARDLGDCETLARALLARHWSIRWPDTLDERLEIAAELIPLAESLEDKELLLQALHCSIADLLELGDMTAVMRESERCSRLAEELRQSLYLWYVALRRAMLANLEGRFDEALDLATAAYELGQRAQHQDAGPIFVALQFPAMEARGRLHELVDRYRSSNVPVNALPDRRVLLILIYCRLNRIGEARAEFEQMAANEFVDLPYGSMRLTTVGNLAEICHLLDDTRRAAALYDLLQPYATHSLINGGLAQYYYGAASRPLGLLATTLARWDEAAQHFQAAIGHDEQMGARPWAARSREDYGRMLLARGDAAEVERARELLQQALTTYRELGMLPAIERTEALLVASGRARRPEQHVNPDGLTARELEVLRLLAAGESNREIAEQLVLSPRTAERHVAGIYRKIGARRRADAISYALQRGLIQGTSPSSE